MLHGWLHGMIAQTAEASGGGGGMLSIVFPFALIFIVMYFLILRPQSQQAKKTQQFLSSLKKGDEVLLTGGLFGKVFEVRDSDLLVELAPNVKVRVLKSGVSGPTTPAPAKASETKPSEAKAEAEKKA